jgi:hypothetical protein
VIQTGDALSPRLELAAMATNGTKTRTKARTKAKPETVEVSRRTLEEWEECLDLESQIADASNAVNELVEDFEAALEMVRRGATDARSIDAYVRAALAYEHKAALALRLVRATANDVREAMEALLHPRPTLVDQSRAVAS